MIEWIASLAAAAFGLSLAFLMTGAEMAAIGSNRRRFHETGDDGGMDRGGTDIEILLGDLRRALSATLAGKALALACLAIGLQGLAARAFSLSAASPRLGPFHASDALALLLAPALFLLFGEVAARAYYRKRALVKPPAPLRLLAPLAWIVAPLIQTIRVALRALLWPWGGASAGRALSREDLARVFDLPAEAPSQASSGEERGEALAAHESMIQNILDMQKTRAVEIMRPLIDVTAIRLGQMNLEGLKALSRATGYSRFPVFRDRIIHLEGFVSVYDVLKNTDPTRDRLEDFIRPAVFIPELARANHLLQRFLAERLSEAILVDEFGACSGLITREDLLEEIVGDIEDEFDRAEPEWIVRQADGGWICDGAVDLDDLNEALGAQFPKDGFETLAGWIFETLARVPLPGDWALFEDWRVEVLEMNRNAIEKVCVRRIAPPAASGA